MTTVAGYTLTEYGGLWFLTGPDDRPVSTILDMGNGLWRARTPDGHARTFDHIPDSVDNPALWVAERITE